MCKFNKLYCLMMPQLEILKGWALLFIIQKLQLMSLDNDSIGALVEKPQILKSENDQVEKKGRKKSLRQTQKGKSARKSIAVLETVIEHESKSKSKAKLPTLANFRKITDYMVCSLSNNTSTKLGSIDQREAKLLEKMRQIGLKEKQYLTLAASMSSLEEKLKRDSAQYSEYKQLTKDSVARNLRQMHAFKRKQNARVIEELGIVSKNSSGGVVFSEGLLFIENRNKQAKLSDLIDELQLRKKKIKNSKDDIEEREDIEGKLEGLKRSLSVLDEEFKKLVVRKNQYVARWRLNQVEQDSRFSKEGWPVLQNRFLPLELLGKGGFSQVYKGFDLEENIDVAIKLSFVAPQSNAQARQDYLKHITREYQTQKMLSHKNIVKLTDVIQIDKQTVATILELCEGPELSTYIKRCECLEQKEAKYIVKQIISALYYLNSLTTKVIHYDLKPQNIMLHNGTIKIVDFGLCKVNDTNQSKIELTSQGTGTYWYLPPQTFDFDQIVKISHKVDIWSTGVIFFEMLFGRRPYGHGRSQSDILDENIIGKATAVQFPPSPKKYKISQECKSFIRQCLQSDQQKRLTVTAAYNHPYFRKSLA